MYTNEEKYKFILSMIDAVDKKSSNDEVLELFNKFILSQTKNGKLYKYRSVNDYSLSNLEDGTLYCALPGDFNDPFDCKVGLDLTSYISYKMDEDLKLFEDSMNDYVNVIKGMKSIETIDVKNKEIVNKLLDNNNLNLFVKKASHLNLNENEVKELLFENEQSLIEMVNILFSCLKFPNGVSKGDFTKDFFEKYKPSVFRNSIGESGMFNQFASNLGINEDVDEISLTTKMYKSLYPNKVEEANKYDKDLLDISLKLNNDINELYRIGCLCESFKNRLMWSHYADSHKGFCIEYDFSNICDEINEMVILPVIYTNERPKFPWALALSSNEKLKIEASKYNILSLVTKDSDWKYENEWRIINLARNNVDNIKMPPISCIYLGALCTEQDKKQLIEITKERNIPVKQMIIDRGKYELHAVNIDNN